MEIGRYAKPLILPAVLVGVAVTVSFWPRDHRPAKPQTGEPAIVSEYDALVDDIRGILKSYKTSIDEDTKFAEDYTDSALGRHTTGYNEDVRVKARAKVQGEADKSKGEYGRFIDTTKKSIDEEFGPPPKKEE